VGLSALTWRVAWLMGLGSLGSWVCVEDWPSAKTPWGCGVAELRVAAQAHVHCGEGMPLLPNQLWLLGMKADLNTVKLEDLKNLPKVPFKVLSNLLEERGELEGFCNWEEVAKIAGVGPVRLKSLEEHLFIQCDTKE